MATRAPTPLLATKEEAADFEVVVAAAAVVPAVVPVVPVGVVAVVGEPDVVGVVIVGVVVPDVAVPLTVPVTVPVAVPVAVPDEARENDTGLGVTLAVAVAERLRAAHSAPCNAIAAVRSVDVQCCIRQAPASAWN